MLEEVALRHSLPVPYQSQSPMNNKDSLLQSPLNISTITTNSRSLLNSRTYLSSTSVPLEVDTISVHDDDAPTDIWVRI
ncbi:unnamed protein product [Rotaria sordida]|uniref:Uncharacterized protein n=1 Tax=Rotaria sordida TaxID=392033 RepID=A0A814ZC69_9BILA|nr:unnamed protein product [Rotaria sordida]